MSIDCPLFLFPPQLYFFQYLSAISRVNKMQIK